MRCTQGIHTLLRDIETDPEDFIFLANRLSTLVIEHALSLLPFRPKQIETPTDNKYTGAELDVPTGHLCGVSILRSGASLEKGLRRVVRDVPVGSVLIQSDAKTGEPLLYQVSLPEVLTTSIESAAKSTVLLLDSQIGTGAAALMAVRILLDHGVKEENIVFCCILVSKVGGVWALKRAFRTFSAAPKRQLEDSADVALWIAGVRIACSAADNGLEERWEKGVDGDKKVRRSRPQIPIHHEPDKLYARRSLPSCPVSDRSATATSGAITTSVPPPSASFLLFHDHLRIRIRIRISSLRLLYTLMQCSYTSYTSYNKKRGFRSEP